VPVPAGIISAFVKEAHDTGLVSPTVGANFAAIGTNPWTNPGNILSSNDVYATVATAGLAQGLRASGFGLTLPPNADILGVLFDIERKASSKAVSYIGSTQATNAVVNDGSVTINVPATAANGDLLIMVIETNGGGSPGPAIPTPTGWTRMIDVTVRVADSPTSYFYRVANSEPASYTITLSAASMVITMTAYRGVDTANPFDVAATAGTRVTSGTTITAPTITTISANALLVCSYLIRQGSTFSTPAGMTERLDYTGIVSVYAQSLDDELRAAPGATGTRASTTSATIDANGAVAVAFALRPAAARDNTIKLIDDTGSVIGANKSAGAMWDTAEGYVTFGGSSDTWSAALTAAMLNSPNFGIALAPDVDTGITASVDHVRARVYYRWAWGPGWSRVASLDGRYTKGTAAGVDPDVTGGALTHGHSSTAHAHTIAAHTHASNPALSTPTNITTQINVGGTSDTAGTSHTHTVPTSDSISGNTASVAATWQSASNEPAYYEVIFIASDGSPTGIPVGGWGMWAGGSLPTGWTLSAAAQNRHFKGAPAAGNGGGSGGGGAHHHVADAHSHGANHSHSATSGASGLQTNNDTPHGNLTVGDHSHSVTFSGGTVGSGTSADMGDATIEPPWYKLGLIRNDNAAAGLPLNLILWSLGMLGAIPSGYAFCDGTNGTPDLRGKFIKGVAALGEVGNTGGALGHGHAAPAAHLHTGAHTHTYSTNQPATPLTGQVPLTGTVEGQHVHGGTSASGGPANTGTTVQDVQDATDSQPPFRTVAFVMVLPALVPAITAPTTTVALPAFTATWDLAYSPAGGTPVQSDYRVRIYDETGVTLLYDSGTIASATQSHTIGSWSPTNNTDYLLRVDVTDTTLRTAFDTQDFTTSWTPPAIISGVIVTPFGGGLSLPGLHVTWDASEPSAGETFVQYNVKRRRAAHTDAFGREVAAGPYVRIAALADIDATAFSDHHTGSGISHEYAVTWTANVSGDLLESDEQEPPGTGVVSWRGAYLHDPADSDVYTQLLVREISVDQQQEQSVLRARGRREDTVFVGEGFARLYEVTPVTERIQERGAWERLRGMLDRQFTGASYCLRIAYSGDVVFGTLEALRVQDRTALNEPAFRFRETHFEEAV